MFRIGYALRKRTGLIRLRLPIYRWQDRPLETWLKNGIPSKPEAYAEWRRQNSPKFFFNPRAPEKYRDYPGTARQGKCSERNDEGSSRHADEARFPSNLPWNPQMAVEEAERIRNGELKYFAHRILQNRISSRLACRSGFREKTGFAQALV